MSTKFKIDNLQENIPLANYTTFRIGGPARYFLAAKNKEELIEALEWAKENLLPYFILGGGSNLLVSDNGFDGLVIKIQNSPPAGDLPKGEKFNPVFTTGQNDNEKLRGNFVALRNEKFKIIDVEAGVPLALLLNKSLAAGLVGLEWAAGIPGTLGGAICGNAGAYRHSISEAVESVEVFNAKDQEIQSYSHKQCEFGYRESIFKKNKNIIVEVKLRLQKGDKTKSQAKIKEYLLTRKNKIPPFPSAGSVFKNIEVKLQSANFQKLIPPEQIKGGMAAAGYLIEQCGLKGRRIGGAQISAQHANFIVNVGGARAADVRRLIDLCQKSVKEKFGVGLEKEIRYVGIGSH